MLHVLCVAQTSRCSRESCCKSVNKCGVVCDVISMAFHHCEVVCLITFDLFCFFCDYIKPKSNHPYVCEVCQHITHISGLPYCVSCLIWKVIDLQ